MLHLIFYFFAFCGIASAVMVVAAKNPVRGVLFLVMTFFSASALWMLLHAEFLALILVLVYVGAVMTLFLFVVMMLNLDLVNLQKSFVRYLPIAALLVCLVVGVTMLAINRDKLTMPTMPTSQPAMFSNTENLGSVLYTHYAYPFEIAAVLLLTAIVAAISLSHRGPRKRKVQNIDEQLAVNPKDRITLINMPPSKGENL